MEALPTRIARERRRPRHRPLDPDALRTVSAIVKDFGLGADFAAALDRGPTVSPKNFDSVAPNNAPTAAEPASDGVSAADADPPADFEARLQARIPPFVLVDADQYRLSLVIVERLANPYLAFARSPEELVLSKRLHALDPNIDSELLARCGITGLWRRRRSHPDPSG